MHPTKKTTLTDNFDFELCFERNQLLASWSNIAGIKKTLRIAFQYVRRKSIHRMLFVTGLNSI